MKRILSFLFVVLLNGYSIAQTSSFFLFNLAIDETSVLNLAQNSFNKALLYKKLTERCNKVDGVMIDDFSEYYLVSDIYTSQSQTSNSGFLPVGSYKMNLKLKLIYQPGGKTFKELNFSKEYVVNTENEAIGLLVNDFSFSESEMNDFFYEGSKRMAKFYAENCDLVLTAARKYQGIGEPEKALAICLSVPTDVPCAYSISKLSKELYTSLSYKTDYAIFLRAQDYVSKGNYESAFLILKGISIYSQFYSEAQRLGRQINNFIFNQKELQKKIELAESEQKLKESEITLQQERNELQQSINQANIEIANQKNESDRQIAAQQQDNQRQMIAMELQSQERREMIKTAGSLLNSYINRPQPVRNTNFYIIK